MTGSCEMVFKFLQSGKLLFDHIGLRRLPQAVMNGVPLDIEEVLFKYHVNTSNTV